MPAFWTGPDQERIDRLFRRSGLMRPKWDERHGAQSYGERTIATALGGRSEFFDPTNRLGPGGSSPHVTLSRFMEMDSGNAEAFAEMYRGKLTFDHRLKRWLIWSEHRWIEDHIAEVRLLAKEIARARLRAAAVIADDDRRKKALRHAVASESRQRLDAMIELAKAEEGIADPGNAWDARADVIAVANGVLDLAALPCSLRCVLGFGSSSVDQWPCGAQRDDPQQPPALSLPDLVHDDAHEPRAKRPLDIERADASPRREQRLLRYVLGGGSIAQQEARSSIQQIAVSLHDRVKPVGLSRLAASYRALLVVDAVPPRRRPRWTGRTGLICTYPPRREIVPSVCATYWLRERGQPFFRGRPQGLSWLTSPGTND